MSARFFPPVSPAKFGRLLCALPVALIGTFDTLQVIEVYPDVMTTTPSRVRTRLEASVSVMI